MKTVYMLLGAVVTVVAAVLFVSVQANDTVYLPMIGSEEQGLESSSERPADEIAPDGRIMRRMPESTPDLKERSAYPPGQMVVVSGPDTRGAVVPIAGRQVQLPATVYIEYVIDHVTVADGQEEPALPIYVLRDEKHTEEWDTLIIDGNGNMKTYSAEAQKVISAHRSIVDTFNNGVSVRAMDDTEISREK